MPITLRPYQEKLVADIRASMALHRRVLAVSPTGSGKTVTFAYITNATMLKGNTITIVVHRSEIIDQICRALDEFNIRYGRIQPGRTMTDDPVQVAMIQTIQRRLDRIKPPSLLVIDEAHHAISPGYVALAAHFPKAKILGVTATPERLDGQGLIDCFDDMVLGPSVRELIETGYLSDFDYYAPKTDADVSQVKIRLGDYANSALAEIMNKPKITGDAVAHYAKYLDGKTAIAFCVNIKHANDVAMAFNAAKIPAASIDGTMGSVDRAIRIDGLKNGQIKVLTSCDLISEGFDVPAVSGAILLRHTKSLALARQQCGRVLRLKPDGSKAVIIDHVNNISRHGTPKTENTWSLQSTKRKSSVSGAQQCDVCFKAFDRDEYDQYRKNMIGLLDKIFDNRGELICDERAHSKCLFHVKSPSEEAASVREIETQAGELHAVSETPDWAHGINIARASGPEFTAMIQKADTIEKLKEIARVRGYHWRWCYHQMRLRQGNAHERNR
jgi:superfamily II DNA or RNA helicase